MPIVFAQPDPYAGAASGGAAELAALSQKYAGANAVAAQVRQEQAQASLANAASFTRSAEADGEQANRRQMFEAARQDRANEFNATQMPSARDNFLADAEQAATVRRAQTQAWVSQQEITQQEVARLNRMQQSVAEIQAKVGKTITQEDADNLTMQLRTGIDPLKQKLNDAKARHEMEQVKKAQEQAKLVTGLQSEDVATRNAAAARLIRKNADGSEGFVGYDGKWVETMKAPKEAKGPDPVKIEATARAEWYKTNQAAKEYANKLRVEKNPDGTLAHPELQSNEGFDQFRRQQLAEAQHGGTPDEHVAKRKAQAGIGQPAGGGGTPSGGAEAGQKPTPYSRNAPLDKLTPEQQNQVQNFAAGMKQLATRPDAGEPHVRGAIESMNKVQDLTEQYGGDPGAMPPAVREEIRRRVAEIERVQQTPPAAPKPQPPAAYAPMSDGSFPSY